MYAVMSYKMFINGIGRVEYELEYGSNSYLSVIYGDGWGGGGLKGAEYSRGHTRRSSFPILSRGLWGWLWSEM